MMFNVEVLIELEQLEKFQRRKNFKLRSVLLEMFEMIEPQLNSH